MAEAKVPFKFKRVGFVVRPQLKIVKNVEYYIKVQGPLHLGKKIDDDKDPATLLDVIDLTTGQECQIIVGTVMREALAEAYPGEKYIGKCFCFELKREEGKDYNSLNTFIEIEPDEAQVSVPKEAPAVVQPKGK